MMGGEFAIASYFKVMSDCLVVFRRIPACDVDPTTHGQRLKISPLGKKLSARRRQTLPTSTYQIQILKGNT
jgi:hypothetical protein